MCLKLENLKLYEKTVSSSKTDELISKKGQDGQGEALVSAKNRKK